MNFNNFLEFLQSWIDEINNKKDLIIKNWNDFLGRNEEKMKALRTAISIYLGSMERSSYDDYILE